MTTCCEELHHDSHLSPGFYWLGNNTLKVSFLLHKENRERFVQRFLSNNKNIDDNSFLLLKGGESTTDYESDHEPLFRQEKFFFWGFGVSITDCYGLISLNSNGKAESVLVVPNFPQDYAVWFGTIHGKEHWKSIFLVDHVLFPEEMKDWLHARGTKTLYTLDGNVNSDSGQSLHKPTFAGIDEFTLDNKTAYNDYTECRVIKSAKEMDVIRYAVDATVASHMKVMKEIKAGMKEYQCESTYLHNAYSEWGCRNTGYTCICAANKNGAILHYGHAGEPNASTLKSGSLCLYDMGSEYHGYTADVTITFPVNGIFTDDQKLVYNAVLDANRQVIANIKPGVAWLDMHLLAERVILEHLVKGGLLKGSVEDLVKNDVGLVFFPHGLGHFFGLDTHDVGGYLDNAPKKVHSLRTTRTLKSGMCITVEPGCYFIDHLLNNLVLEKPQFVNIEVLQRFRGFGGIRLEDDILVTDNGSENLSAALPRTVEEIEKFMSKN
ncbi:peptidase D [Tieghemostelium lacteum]|uniref:Xaa-Pro dipeptidase n=1 Tax=Tieghemostelium lacteum TaxID=361077 RepID=A0A152A9U5_TIELA|nr:peptidase D [Tieghemostelium lacteum]|eukprot:KYR02984.1 peptidase D [Tieghemostelium lacteum]